MVAKMIRWRPWPLLVTKKYQLNLVLHSLEALGGGENGGLKDCSKLMALIKWNGPRRKLGSRFRSIQKNCTSFHGVGDDGIVGWEETFGHVCVLTLLKDNAFHRWDVGIQIITEILEESKSRQSVVGTALLNLGDFASPLESTKQTTKIPISCCIGGVTKEAALVVTLGFEELQTTQIAFDPVQRLLIPLSCMKGPCIADASFIEEPSKRSEKDSSDEDGSNFSKRSPLSSEECETPELYDLDSIEDCEDVAVDEGSVSTFYGTVSYDTLAAVNLLAAAVCLDGKEDRHGVNELVLPKLIDETSSSDSDPATPPVLKRTLLSWRAGKFSFKSPRAKGEPLLNKACREEGGDDIDLFRRQQSPPYGAIYQDSGNGAKSNFSAFGDDQFTIGSWERKELFSRDGKMKLSTQVFFGSIDQRNERAAGESACTALVAVLAHWLHTNPNSMPVKSQFDMLIREGSQEWRKLCDVDDYKERFPDGHFDLDTILQAKVHSLSVIPEKSFVGFFRLEGLQDSFDFLQGCMSFDEIWEEITNASNVKDQDEKQHIYIVSWNDHFFVLKVENDCFYIIDTLGERLFEGCNQAYILKFDKETTIYQLPAKDPQKGEQSSTVSASTSAKDSKNAVLKDSKSIAAAEDSVKSSSAKNSKPSTKDSKSVAEAEDSVKSSSVKNLKLSTKDSKSISPKDFKSMPSVELKSATEEDQTSLTAKDLKISKAEGLKCISAGSTNQEQQDDSKTEVRDTRELEVLNNIENDNKLICEGKESCKAFIKGFLAALPLRQLQADLEKGLMGRIPLHQRLQIEFHYTAE